MALDTMLKNLSEARAAYNAQLSELENNGREAVAAFLSPLVPPGYAVQWTQYTDYFNDGSPCTFSVHEPQLVKATPTDEDEEDSDDEHETDLGTAIDRYGLPDEEKSYQRNNYAKPLPLAPGASPFDRKYEQETVKYVDRGFPAIEGSSKEKLQELSNAWDKLPEDLMQNAFGDHVRCRVYSTGEVTVSGYTDHD